MFFLTIKKHQRERKDGLPHAQAFAIRKDRKGGKVLEQQHMSVRRPVLITGPHACGKSRWLDRLREDHARVWASRSKATPLYLSSIWPVSDWTEGKHLELWWADRCRKSGEDDRHWRKLTPSERQRALPLYIKETGALLFVDDAHKLTGKKLEIAKLCVRAADVWVMTTADEGRLSPALRKDALARDPQIFRLESEVAYDYTPQFMWFMAAFFLAIGFPAGAVAVGGINMLSRGRKAAKQN